MGGVRADLSLNHESVAFVAIRRERAREHGFSSKSFGERSPRSTTRRVSSRFRRGVESRGSRSPPQRSPYPIPTPPTPPGYQKVNPPWVEVCRSSSGRAANSQPRVVGPGFERRQWIGARMPKTLHCSVRLDMAAEEYHALRMDQNFDTFCAERTESTFNLIARSSSHEELKGHTIEHMESLLAYQDNPVPAAFHGMLGAPLSPAWRLPPPCSSRPPAGMAGTKDFAFKYQSRWRACLSMVQPASPAAVALQTAGLQRRGALPVPVPCLGQQCRCVWGRRRAESSSPRFWDARSELPYPTSSPNTPSPGTASTSARITLARSRQSRPSLRTASRYTAGAGLSRWGRRRVAADSDHATASI